MCVDRKTSHETEAVFTRQSFVSQTNHYSNMFEKPKQGYKGGRIPYFLLFNPGQRPWFRQQNRQILSFGRIAPRHSSGISNIMTI